jgi:hypothetical protein
MSTTATEAPKREPRVVRDIFLAIDQPTRLRDGSEVVRYMPIWRGEVAYVTVQEAAMFDTSLMGPGETVEDFQRELEQQQLEYRSTRQSIAGV